MSKLVNRAKMTTATTGTGTITLGSASGGYQTFAAAGVTNGDVINYVIEDGADWEIGEGTYTSSGTTLSRTFTESSTGSLLNLSGSATVFVTAFAKDLWKWRSLRYFVSGTYTPGPDVRAFLVSIMGSIGGRSANSGGSGGAGYAEKYYASGFAGNTYTVIIGANGASTGTSGGTTEFLLSGVGLSVTGGAGATTASGSAGGVASGGDLNADGGSGGSNNGTTAFGGAGGGGGRSGAGGNGAAAVGSSGGGGGGTGGNNASGSTGGAAATTLSASAYPLEEIFSGPYFSAGASTTTTAGGAGAAGGQQLDNAPMYFGHIGAQGVQSAQFGGFAGLPGAAASAFSSTPFVARITIIEWWS